MTAAPFWRGRRVLLTGHTGFKGGWLALWLHRLGAEVHGLALEPPSQPNLFEVARIAETLATSRVVDVRDAPALAGAVRDARPEIVFHLAAQSLVRTSYAAPAATYAVNLLGTVNLFEALRGASSVRAVVNVTSDKCYANRGSTTGFREDDPLGGSDPYSSSKACAELATEAYRRSFFADAGVWLASARAGNVIGGGDWAVDRLVPDFLRAADAGRTLLVRAPDAVRPWQHVLEPLSGYLLLAERLISDGTAHAEGWNFGPADADAWPVRRVVDALVAATPGAQWQVDTAVQPPEAGRLALDIEKARTRLNWQPRWRLDRALKATLQWHTAWRGGKDMREATLAQIESFEASAHRAGA